MNRMELSKVSKDITIDEDFKSIVSSRFSEVLNEWFLSEPEERISIQKINMCS